MTPSSKPLLQGPILSVQLLLHLLACKPLIPRNLSGGGGKISPRSPGKAKGKPSVKLLMAPVLQGSPVITQLRRPGSQTGRVLPELSHSRAASLWNLGTKITGAQRHHAHRPVSASCGALGVWSSEADYAAIVCRCGSKIFSRAHTKPTLSAIQTFGSSKPFRYQHRSPWGPVLGQRAEHFRLLRQGT